MKFVTALLAASATLAFAAPSKRQDAPVPQDNCITIDRAYYLTSRATVYLQKADLAEARAAGEELYGDGYQQYGDSINALRGDPLGTLVEEDGPSYINNTLSAPPIREINTLAVLYNCTHVFWQWEFLGVGGPTGERVRGFTLMTVDIDAETQPITEQYVEFNSLTWAANSGFNITAPTEGTFAPDDSTESG